MSLFKGLFSRLTRRQKPGAVRPGEWVTPPIGAVPSSSFLIGRHHFVFAIEWQFCANAKELAQTMRTAQAQGFTHYAVSQTRDMVGYGVGVEKGLGKTPFSAALHLAETVSLSGLEVFIFELPDGHYSLTALNDSHPVPHFDQVVSHSDDVLALVAEYQTLQGGHPIRFVGNIDFLETIEKVTLTEAFARPDSTSIVRKLPNYKFRQLILSILLPSMLMVAAGGAWFEYQRQEEEKARIAREQDPNYIYENQIVQAMQQTGLRAQITLDRWREAVYRLPTARAGWKLEKIVCQPSNCNVTWQRDFGSYVDFHEVPLEGASNSSETQTGESPAKATISTILNIPSLPDESKGLTRDKLPQMRETLQQVASQLQDISLVPDAAVQLKQPELYPNTGATAEQIARPVVRGEWTISHELWTLGDLEFEDPTLVLQSLTIQQDEKTKNWIYTLTGHYYAKGKNY